jgi:hypothetical protein
MAAAVPIPVIDLFAGPGGLNEGLAACRDATGVARSASRWRRHCSTE